MKLFFPAEPRFDTDFSRKVWFERLIAEICAQALSLLPSQTMPVEFRRVKKASNVVVNNGIMYAAAANQIAKIIILGAICDVKNKDSAVKALIAIIFTAAAEMVNHHNYFTVGYANEMLGIACQNLLADARKRTTANNFEMLRYENFTMIGSIGRSFCNNEELIIEALPEIIE